MWFRNLYIYSFTRPLTLTAEQLEDLLSQRPLTGCNGQEPLRLGWSCPAGVHEGPLLIRSDSRFWLRQGREERLLPSSVVREILDERAREIHETTGMRVTGKRKRDLKDDIIAELMPRAFTRRQYTDLLIDQERGLLLVAAGTDKRADEATSLLRETLGALPIKRLEPRTPIIDVLSLWVQHPQHLPQGWQSEDHIELRSKDADPAIVGFRKMTFSADDLRPWLADGFKVNRLRMTWRNEIQLTLDDHGRLRGMRHLELMKERLEGRDQDDLLLEAQTLLSLLGPVWSELATDVLHTLGTDATASDVAQPKPVLTEA